MNRRSIYYGWYITIALAITETISWGITFYAFSVFITPMEADLEWTRTQITGGFSLALFVSAVMAYPVGAWVDRHGARLLMTVGSIGASLLVFAWSQVTNLTVFYLIWFGLGICFAAILYDPAFAVVTRWFVQKRGQALATITFAAGLASTIFIPLSDWLLRLFEWRGAVMVLAVILAITTIPLHWLILRRQPDDLGLVPDGELTAKTSTASPLPEASLNEALHSPAYWQLVAAFSLSYLAASAIRVHFIPFLQDIGIKASVAAVASGSIGFMQVTGRLIFAPLDTRFSGKTMVIGVFAMQAAAMAILLLGSAAVWVGLFIVIFGTSYGARTLVRPALLAEMYGSANFGRISSIMMMFLIMAATVAPVGAGWMYDRYGSYQPVLWIIVGLMIAATGILFYLKPNLYQRTEPNYTEAGSISG